MGRDSTFAAGVGDEVGGAIGEGDGLGTGYVVVVAPVESFRLMFTVTAKLGDPASPVVTVLSLDG